MDKVKLNSIIEVSPDKRSKLLALIKETKEWAIENEKYDPRLPGQTVDVVASYEAAALAYPWQDLVPPGDDFPHAERYLDIVPYLDKKQFIVDMEKNQVRVVDTGAKDSLLAGRYRLVVLEPDVYKQGPGRQGLFAY